MDKGTILDPILTLNLETNKELHRIIKESKFELSKSEIYNLLRTVTKHILI